MSELVFELAVIEATGYSRETVRRLIMEGRQILTEGKS